MIRWLQESKVASVFLFILRMFLGWGWLAAGYGKLQSGFDATGYLQGAIDNPVIGADGTMVYPWYTWLVENVFMSMMPAINLLIPWGEVLVGLGLLLGGFTGIAVFFGLTMNFMFLFAGTVSVNPLYVVISVFILVAGYNAGVIGLDRFLKPVLNSKFFSVFNYHFDKEEELETKKEFKDSPTF